MNPKFKITKVVLESLGLDASDKRIKETIPSWWANPRKKEKGGLRLTDQGFECLQKADIKFYRVQFDQKVGVYKSTCDLARPLYRLPILYNQ